jgi:SAM-dependent methyltransferase
MSLQEHYAQKYAVEEGRPARIREYPRDRKEAVAKLAAGGTGRLLEVGAGSGDVLLAVAKTYTEVVATEFTPARAARLRELGFTVVEGAIEGDLPYGPRSFDTIILNDVVEHLLEPFDVLRYLRELLAPEGRLILHTPNVAYVKFRAQALWGRAPATSTYDEGLLDWHRRPTTALDDGHLHYFTWRSLTRVLTERAGFSSVEWHPYGHGRPARYALYCRLAERLPTLLSDCCVVAHP